MKKSFDLALECDLEDLAHALYIKGESLGYHNITDKTKWREVVMADWLGHQAHPKISAGAGSENYGSDATNPETSLKAEYKSQALCKKKIRNLLQIPRSENSVKTFAPLRVTGVYNGAYKTEAVDAYRNCEHYFGIFHKEQCLLIVKPHTDEVCDTLNEEIERRESNGKAGTSNLNSVSVDLSKTETYEVAYVNEDFDPLLKKLYIS